MQHHRLSHSPSDRIQLQLPCFLLEIELLHLSTQTFHLRIVICNRDSLSRHPIHHLHRLHLVSNRPARPIRTITIIALPNPRHCSVTSVVNLATLPIHVHSNPTPALLPTRLPHLPPFNVAIATALLLVTRPSDVISVTVRDISLTLAPIQPPPRRLIGDVGTVAVSPQNQVMFSSYLL